jgi:hypothetical protein
VKVESNVLLVAKHAVACVPLEIVPNPFGGIEFRSVGWEAFKVKWNTPGTRDI